MLARRLELKVIIAIGNDSFTTLQELAGTPAPAHKGEPVTEQHYLSYLLRLWQTCDGQTRIWRASLESPGTGERRGFADLQALFDFLSAEIGQDQSSDQPYGRHSVNEEKEGKAM